MHISGIGMGSKPLFILCGFEALCCHTHLNVYMLTGNIVSQSSVAITASVPFLSPTKVHVTATLIKHMNIQTLF